MGGQNGDTGTIDGARVLRHAEWVIGWSAQALESLSNCNNIMSRLVRRLEPDEYHELIEVRSLIRELTNYMKQSEVLDGLPAS